MGVEKNSACRGKEGEAGKVGTGGELRGVSRRERGGGRRRGKKRRGEGKRGKKRGRRGGNGVKREGREGDGGGGIKSTEGGVSAVRVN